MKAERVVVADAMLLKLARWLRMAGIKTYTPKLKGDDALISYVRRKHGVLITQDEALAMRSKKRGFSVVLIKGEGLEEQLAFAARELGRKISSEPSMVCPMCNSDLVEIRKEKAKVPNNFKFRENGPFYRCEGCRRAYWKGTHWRAIRKRLIVARKLAKSKTHVG